MEKLLKKCKYYDGGKIIPSSEPISFFWKVERAWVSASLRHPNSFGNIINRFNNDIGNVDVVIDKSLVSCMYVSYLKLHECKMDDFQLKDNFKKFMMSY